MPASYCNCRSIGRLPKVVSTYRSAARPACPRWNVRHDPRMVFGSSQDAAVLLTDYGPGGPAVMMAYIYQP